MNRKLESKLSITIEPSTYINYDVDKLFSTIVFFCYQNLKHINPVDLPEIFIEIDTPYCKEIEPCGTFITFDENVVLIALSTKNIKEESDAKCNYNSLIKSLLKIFLHEFYHLYDLIESYLKSDRTVSMEVFAKNRHKDRMKIRKKLRRQGLDLTDVDLNMPSEQDADWFAYQNLSLLENLYESDFLYTPQRAFMAKIKAGCRG
jgi:hypothetical protein